MDDDYQQETKIIRFCSNKALAKESQDDTQIKNLTKRLLNFRKKLDNLDVRDRKCQIASLEDLQMGHTLKLLSQEPQSFEGQNIVPLKKREG